MNASRSRFQPAIRSLIIAIVLLTLASGVRAAAWKEKVLYSFQGIPDGATPAGGVVFDPAGNLYGATSDGGANNCPGIAQCGTVYQLQPPTKKGKLWTEKVLYVFKGVNSNDGETPASGVLFDPAGNLYGTTAYGGSGDCVLFGNRVGCGTVYQIVPPKQKGGAWTESVIYSFKGGKDGYLPEGDLTLDANGNLYGATQYGGGFGSCNAPYYQYCGTVFTLSPPKTKGGKWNEQVLYAFKNGKDGANPNGRLVLDTKGAIYGTTYFGGDEGEHCKGGVGGTGCGIVFAVQPPTTKAGAWTEKVLHRFDGLDGANSAAGVTFDRNGNLYGTSYFGPPNGFGLVFELKKPFQNTHSWTETVLHLFSNGNDGGYPVAGLIFDTSGNLYGMALGGRISGGVVFRLRHAKRGGPWPFTVLYNLTGSPDGNHPTAAPIFDGKGNLYGTTQWGGTGQSCQGGCGAVFEVTP